MVLVYQIQMYGGFHFNGAPGFFEMVVNNCFFGEPRRKITHLVLGYYIYIT